MAVCFAALDRDVLEALLAWTDAPWLVRLACRLWAATEPRRTSPLATAVTSPERCRWALSVGAVLPSAAARVAATLGELAVLESMARGGFAHWTLDMCVRAARAGHVEAWRWLVARRPSLEISVDPPEGCDVSWCADAARRGDLHILRWLRHLGCPWDRSTCTASAEAGHLEVLRWAHQVGCTCDDAVARWAIRAGHPHILEWMRAHQLG